MAEIKKVSPIKSFSFSKKNSKKSTESLSGGENPTKTEKLYTQLGNKVKELRLNHNLTRAALADLLQMSSAYIGMIERGEKGGSVDLLGSMEEIFKVEHGTLIKLQEQQITDGFQEIERKQSIVYQQPDYIQGLLETLLSLDEDYAKQMVADFMKLLQDDYFKRLTPFEIKEVKKKVIVIKRSWFQEKSKKIDSEDENRIIQGCIINDHHKHFFSLELTPFALQLNLLHNDRQQAQYFESWLGVCSVSYTNSLQLPYLKSDEKITSYLWFNPQTSTTDMYEYLNSQGLNMNAMEINDPRLNCFIREMTVDNELNK